MYFMVSVPFRYKLVQEAKSDIYFLIRISSGTTSALPSESQKPSPPRSRFVGLQRCQFYNRDSPCRSLRVVACSLGRFKIHIRGRAVHYNKHGMACRGRLRSVWSKIATALSSPAWVRLSALCIVIDIYDYDIGQDFHRYKEAIQHATNGNSVEVSIVV